MPSFRLDHEPWVPVLWKDGTSGEVSLLEVFRKAEAIASLSGTPLEVAGMIRLLLAICQCADTPQSLAEWKKRWEDRPAYFTKVIAYIEANEGAWDLFSPERPFLQAPGLAKHATEGQPQDPDILDRSKIGRDAHVEHSAYRTSCELPAGAAARALLVVHGFCIGGMGTPNPLIPKNGKHLDKFSNGSLLAQSTVAFLEGDDLSITLLLNLLVEAELGQPGWEWRDFGSRERRPASGLLDRYTRPVRSVLLFPSEDGSHSTSAFVTSGPAFTDEDQLDDPLIPHRPDSTGKRYIPFRYEAGVALWRNAHALLASEERPLPLVSQLSRVRERNPALDFGSLQLRVVGVTGKLGQVKHNLWRDERLAFGATALEKERAVEVRQALASAKERASQLRKQLYGFAVRYLQNGTEIPPDKNEAGRLADELSPNLNDYWSAISPMGERIACDGFDEEAWGKLLHQASADTFRKAIERLPPDARRFRAEYAYKPKKATA